MLLARLKLTTVFDRAFHAMADMQWRMLWLLIAAHAVSSWALLVGVGESGVSQPADFLYWYATTAYTVGYGDISPETVGGRLVTALWVFPGAIAGFTTVVAKVLAAIGDLWRSRRAGKGDYSRMSDTILLIGHDAARTPKMIDELCSERSSERTIVVLTRQALTDPDPRIRYVQTESLTSTSALKRAGIAGASRVLVYAASDADTLAATLAASAAAPSGAHVVCFFEDADNARLIQQHCPLVEVVVASGAEMLARAAIDPGASQVITALTSHLDEGATLFSLTWQAPPSPVGELRRRLEALQATLLAVQEAGDHPPRFNPAADGRLAPGDRLFYVSRARLPAEALAGG